MSNVIEYKDCYVAFIDVLGFKNIIQNGSCEEIYSIFEDLSITGRMRFMYNEDEVIALNDDKYTTFIGGDMPLIKYTTDVKNGEKLVIIKESFGNAFATWAVNNYEEVYIIDPRQWNGFNAQSDHGEFNLVKFYNEVCQFDDLMIISYPGSATAGLRNAISKLVGI